MGLFKFRKNNEEAKKLFEENESLLKKVSQLSVEKSTLEFQIRGLQEKLNTANIELKEAKSGDLAKLKMQKAALEEVVRQYEFRAEHDSSNADLETASRKLASEVSVLKAENEHLKKLLEAYRSMPDVQNMVKNLSNLSVPGIDALKEFAKLISDSKANELMDALKLTNNHMQALSYQIERDRFRM